MAFKDILVALASYPEPPSASVVQAAVAVAELLDAHITALSCEVHIELPGHFISGSTFGLPGIIAAEVEKSRQQAQELLVTFEAAASKAGIPHESYLQKCKSFEVPDVFCEFARLRDLTILPQSDDRWDAESVIFGAGWSCRECSNLALLRSGPSLWRGISAALQLAPCQTHSRC